MSTAPVITLGPRAVARVAAALWVGCGGLVAIAIPVFAAADEMNRGAVVGIGLAAVAIGAVVSVLPWDRWSPNATLLLVPVAFAMVALYNWAASDPWSYDIFFLISFAWVGLAHPLGTSLKAAPLLVVAYLLPLVGRADSHHGVASLLYVLPSSILLGEAVSWVATRLRLAEADRAMSEARYSALVRHASEVAVVLDDDGKVTFVSAAIERVLGIDPDSLIGADGSMLVHADDVRVVGRRFAEARAEQILHEPVLFRARHADGGWRWLEGTMSDLRSDPSIAGIVVNGRDVTERVEAEDRLAHLARHDPLTGLPNRAALLDELGRTLARAERRGIAVAVLFLDLDGFKVVNDSLGHAVGDELLVAVSERVRRILRTGDLLARLGGDEFTIVVEDLADESEAVALADRLVAGLRAPLDIAGRRHVVSASIGIAIGAPGQRDAADLLRQADLAMYRAKELGKARYEVFDHGLARRARRRLDVDAELRVAIASGEGIELHFQPEFDIAADSVVAMEALVRWNHPVRGLLPPAEFLDVAEESDLIVDLGRIVLERSCETAAQWWGMFGDGAPQMSVNVSARQLQSPDFVGTVRLAMATVHLPASLLRLEVTESVLADAVAPDVLAELQEMGVAVAIDDFGTGYSSLSYLDRLPVDVVKIDRAFLAPVFSADDRAPVVEAALAVARSLGLEVVAEGVETPAHVGLLLRLGCYRAQGFFFGRPTPRDVAQRLLGAQQRLHVFDEQRGSAGERGGRVDQPHLLAPRCEELETDR